MFAGFSSRRAQIEAAPAESGQHSARAARIATLTTPPDRPEPIEPEQQRQRRWAQTTELGLDTDQLGAVFGRSYETGVPARSATPPPIGWSARPG